jgi:WD40 repeat protein
MIREIGGLGGTIGYLALSPTCDRIAASGWAKPKVFGASGGQASSGHSGGSELIGWQGGYLRIWDLGTGKLLHTLEETEQPLARAIAFTGDGDELLALHGDYTLNGWDARTGTRFLALRGLARRSDRGRGRPEPGLGAAFSGDARRAASLDSIRSEQVLVAWDFWKSEARILEWGHETLWCIALSPKGERIAVISWDHQVRILDFGTGRLVRRINEDAKTSPTCLAFSSDGKRVASGDQEGVVRIWDASDSRRLATFTGPKGSVDRILLIGRDLRAVTVGIRDPKPVPLMVWDAKIP